VDIFHYVNLALKFHLDAMQLKWCIVYQFLED